MAVNTPISVSWLPLSGRLAGAVLGAGAVLLVSYVASLATGLLQFQHVTIATFEPCQPIRYSIHFFGAIVNDSEPLFRVLCALFPLPSLAIGSLVWRHLGLRWGTW